MFSSGASVNSAWELMLADSADRASEWIYASSAPKENADSKDVTKEIAAVDAQRWGYCAGMDHM
jgi:hypothetical protein